MVISLITIRLLFTFDSAYGEVVEYAHWTKNPPHLEENTIPTPMKWKRLLSTHIKGYGSFLGNPRIGGVSGIIKKSRGD